MEKKTALRHIDVMSAARMNGAIELVFGLIIALFVLLFSVLIGAVLPGFSRLIVGIGLVMLILIPIVLLFVGFLVAGFEAWVYNAIGSKIGYIKLTIKNNKLSWIDPDSAARVGGAIGLVVGFFAGLVVMFAGIGAGNLLLALFGLFGLVGFMLVFGVLMFAAFAAGALVYNYLVLKVGPIRLWFKGNALNEIDVVSYAKISAVFGAIGGFVQGLVHTISSIFLLAFIPSAASAVGLFAIIVLPIATFIGAFVGAAIVGVLYNRLAPRIGGLELTIS